MYTLTYLSDRSFKELVQALKNNGLNGWARTLEMNATSGDAPTVQDWMDSKSRVRLAAQEGKTLDRASEEELRAALADRIERRGETPSVLRQWATRNLSGIDPDKFTQEYEGRWTPESGRPRHETDPPL